MTQESERRRILVIDDNDAIHGDFRKTLEKRTPTQRLAAATAALFDEPVAGAGGTAPAFEVESAMQGQEGFAKVERAVKEGRPYALAFVDMRMPPGWDGVETIQHLWRADPELQVVICTAFTDYSWEQITSALGPSDRFLILKKPFDPMEVCQLATALTEKWKLKRQATLKVAELERMVHERTAELQRMAMLDRLTRLPNRALLHEMLKKASSRASADPAFKFAVHFIDFDRFKVVNDSLGHDVGDQLLIAIADRLRGMPELREEKQDEQRSCFAARLGGDEFVILQSGIREMGEVLALAERLLETLAPGYHLNGFEVNSTASIGISTSDVASHWSDDILRDADSAMYVAKSLGKARYAVFNHEMHEQAVTRLTLESDLRRAIKQGELFLEYQPIVSLADARPVGFEALVRWRHPTRGVVSPADFIPIAEETGLIGELGRWVLHEAVRRLAEWRRTMPEAAELSMSVNCSRKQLADAGFGSYVHATLAELGVPHARLNLEVTESAVMEDPVHVRNLLLDLQSAGMKIHMDDFGTGYSSLNCLHGLPLSVLKIDRSFIHNMSQRRDYAAVINAIIVLAHNLNMQVVAEGVETADHAAILCALECDLAQGYFFSRPLSADKATAFVLASAKGTTNPASLAEAAI
jgi:diguanylate cyclase (GGDEF)-like protein